jgi:hypothetical protein
MGAGTSEWQRVDNTGCLPWVFRAFLLSWAIILPYAVVVRSFEWFAWSLLCVIAGVWLTLRHRAQRAWKNAEMNVEVEPSEVSYDLPVLVTLQVAGEKSRNLRWWRAEMMTSSSDGSETESKVVASGEFAIDPDASVAPVSELQMVLNVPPAPALHEFAERDRNWWIQVTAETASGRLESGRVPLRMVDS